MPQEHKLIKEPSFSLTSDYVRMVIGGESVLVNPTDFANDISSLITGASTSSTIRDVNTNTVITLNDNTLSVDCTSGNIQLIMPDPAQAFDSINNQSNIYRIAQKISNSNSVTLVAHASENFYYQGISQSGITLTSGSVLTLQSDGVDWIVVGA